MKLTIRSPKMITIAAIASMLLLTGCFKLDTEASISTDDKVSGSFAIGLNEAMLSMMGESSDDLFSETDSPVSEEFKDAPWMKDVTQSKYEKDGFSGTKISFIDVPIKNFNNDILPILDMYAAEESSSSGPSTKAKKDPKYPNVKIEHKDDSFVVSGVIDYTEERAIAAGSEDTGGMEGFEGMTAGGGSVLSLTFPGPVESKTGKVDGNTVTWDVKLGDRVDVDATASALASKTDPAPVSEPGTGGTDDSKVAPWLFVAIALLVLAAAGAAVFFFRRSRSADVVGEEDESTLIDHTDGDASATSAALDWSGPGPGATPYVEPQEQSAPVVEPAEQSAPVAEQGSGRRRADVPVDSAPATPAVEPVKVEPGWYPTADGLTLRWHDGTDWTEHTHPAQ